MESWDGARLCLTGGRIEHRWRSTDHGCTEGMLIRLAEAMLEARKVSNE